MRGLALLGVVLVVLGLAGLAFDHFTYTDTKPVLKAGPIQVNKQEDHTISFPLVGSIVVLLAGVVLIVAGRKQA
ncbi:MAG TPA: hypothetical protein VH000_04510 [Rhizomicrobium sp.]|jgi:uncharacterized membrane protein|nr:hypothetical protein [Rhizomicrobium sp.]HEX4533470.1 hypothetical protein [Rhizomicrobium sp.]